LAFESLELESELVGPLAMAFAGGFEIADANFQGLALGLARGGLDLPGIAGPDQLGDQNPRRRLKRGRGNHGASCPKWRNSFAE